jgi:hypothetical protein
LAFDRAVHSRAADAGQVGDLGGPVLAAVHQEDQVGLLATVAIALLALGDVEVLQAPADLLDTPWTAGTVGAPSPGGNCDDSLRPDARRVVVTYDDSASLVFR